MEEKDLEQSTPQTEKVASIGNQYTKEQIQAFNKDQKRIIFRRRRLAVVFTITLVLFALSGLNLFRNYQHIKALNTERITVKAEQAEINERVVALERDIKLLEDEEYLLKLARKNYFYSKEGELIFSLPQVNPNSEAEVKADEQKTKQSSTTNTSK